MPIRVTLQRTCCDLTIQCMNDQMFFKEGGLSSNFRSFEKSLPMSSSCSCMGEQSFNCRNSLVSALYSLRTSVSLPFPLLAILSVNHLPWLCICVDAWSTAPIVVISSLWRQTGKVPSNAFSNVAFFVNLTELFRTP